MKKFLAVVLSAVVFLSGCSNRAADLTVASTKNYNINSNKFIKGKRVTGSDTVPIILFPLGMPNVEEAIDKAIEGNKCAVGLSDVVIYEEFFSLLIGFAGYRVEGTEIIDQSLLGCSMTK